MTSENVLNVDNNITTSYIFENLGERLDNDTVLLTSDYNDKSFDSTNVVEQSYKIIDKTSFSGPKILGKMASSVKKVFDDGSILTDNDVRILNYNDKNFVISYSYVPQDGKIYYGYLSNYDFAFALKEINEQTTYFAYTSYQLDTPYITYSRYLGNVIPTSIGTYIGNNIPLYDIKAYITDIDNNSIVINKYDSDVFVDNNEDTWWYTAETGEYLRTKITGDEYNNVSDFISAYTLNEAESIIEKANEYNTYIVNKFTYFIPKCIRYVTREGLYTNYPINETSDVSTIYTYVLYNETNKQIDLHFTSTKNDESIEDKIYYVTNKTDNTGHNYYNEIYFYNENGVPQITFKDYILELSNGKTSKCKLSFSYDYIDNNYIICSSYLDDISKIFNNDDNIIGRYAFIEVSIDNKNVCVQTSISKYKESSESNESSESYHELTPLYSNKVILKNELEENTSNNIFKYSDYLTKITNLNKSEFFELSYCSYNFIYKKISDNVSYISSQIYPFSGLSTRYTYYNGESYVNYDNLYTVKFDDIILGFSKNFNEDNDDIYEFSYRLVNIQQTGSLSSPKIYDKTTYSVNPFQINNYIEPVFDSYKYVEPEYSYTLTYDLKGSYIIQDVMVKNGHWEKNFVDKVKPLLNVSYTYSSSPVEISRNNIAPTMAYEILGFKQNHELSYYTYVDKFVENFIYSYFDDNIEKQYVIDDTVKLVPTNNENEFYALKLDESDKISNVDIVYKKSIINKESVLEKKIIQNEELEPIYAYVNSAFSISNKRQVNVTDMTYVPESYVDILTVNPVTGEQYYERQLKHESYISYTYEVVDIPLKTETYIYNQNDISISYFDNLVNAINNFTTYSSNAIEVSSNFYDSLERELKDITFAVDNSYSFSYLTKAIEDSNNNIANAINQSQEKIYKNSELFNSNVRELFNNQTSAIKKLTDLSYNISYKNSYIDLSYDTTNLILQQTTALNNISDSISNARFLNTGLAGNSNYQTYSNYDSEVNVTINSNELNLKNKGDFIIAVSKDIFINTNFLLSSASPSEYAKQAIYRASCLWDALESAGAIKQNMNDPIVVTYVLKHSYNLNRTYNLSESLERVNPPSTSAEAATAYSWVVGQNTIDDKLKTSEANSNNDKFTTQLVPNNKFQNADIIAQH